MAATFTIAAIDTILQSFLPLALDKELDEL
jgi:hypothetical protein